MSPWPERSALAIVGPTAIGKTALAMALADHLPVRIISVDSAMVFRHMNIGTAKPDAAELAAYPHALIDLIEPDQSYSAAAFLDAARLEVQAAWQAGELPVLVGGTMLYFRALREGLARMPERDAGIRSELAEQLATKGVESLHAELEQVDPAAAAKIDVHNQQRLVRALEVQRLTGTPISEFWLTPQQGLLTELGGELYEHALLPLDRKALHERINQRFLDMLDAGFVAEVEALYARGDLGADMASMRCVGYRQLWPVVAGAQDLSSATLAGQAATRQLAKRQLTWLRGWQAAGKITPWICESDPRVHLQALLKGP